MLQTLAYIAQIAGGVGLLVAAGTYLIHRSQLHFNIIMSCNQRFQEILVDLEEQDDLKVAQAKKRYIDLCNEQLFYFSNGYLPREVMEEWLESMIDYLPLFDAETGIVHPAHRGRVNSELLRDYPKIRSVFVVDPSDELSTEDQRLAFVRRIGKQIRPEPVLLVFWRDVRDQVPYSNRRQRVEAFQARN